MQYMMKRLLFLIFSLIFKHLFLPLWISISKRPCQYDVSIMEVWVYQTVEQHSLEWLTNVKANSTKHTCSSCDLFSDETNMVFSCLVFKK